MLWQCDYQLSRRTDDKPAQRTHRLPRGGFPRQWQWPFGHALQPRNIPAECQANFWQGARKALTVGFLVVCVFWFSVCLTGFKLQCVSLRVAMHVCSLGLQRFYSFASTCGWIFWNGSWRGCVKRKCVSAKMSSKEFWRILLHDVCGETQHKFVVLFFF